MKSTSAIGIVGLLVLGLAVFGCAEMLEDFEPVDVVVPDGGAEADALPDDAGCGAGLAACAGACVDSTTDPANCGACGNACAADQRCVGGRCEGTCADECPAALARQCATDGYDVCADYDVDGCLEWGGHVACGSGGACDEGECGGRDVARLGPEIMLAAGEFPVAASDSHGNPHVIFEDHGIWYTVGEATTGRFAAPVRIAEAGNEPQLIIDENDDVHAVWNIGRGLAGTSGWYTNNIGGSWKPAVRALSLGEFGTERVMQGRVLKVPGRQEVVTAWSGGKDREVLVSFQNVDTGPSVLRRVAALHWVPGLVLDPSHDGFRVVARTLQGIKATDYDFALGAHGAVMVTDCKTKGESGWGVLTSDGEVHYTGSPGGTATDEGPAQVWYSSDARIAAGLPEIRGMVVSLDGGTARTWTAICVDTRGQAYVTHSSLVDANAWIAYVQGEELISVALAADYGAPMRGSPSCSPTAVGGVHVVYHVGRQVFYRTVGLP